MVGPRLGEVPTAGAEGQPGYTVRQTARLLGQSEGTVRSKYEGRLIPNGKKPALCPAPDVERDRASLLAKLGAVEPSSPSTAASPPADAAHLRQRVAFLEERFRLLLAARQSARESERMRLGEEEAYMDIILQELTLAEPQANT